MDTLQAEGRPATSQPWAKAVEDVARELTVSLQAGLEDTAAAKRLREFGPNQLGTVRPRSLPAILWSQLASAVIVLLLVAAAVAMVFGDHVEAWAIIAVVVINTLIGFVTEWRAVRSMEALRLLSRAQTQVRRSGRTLDIPAEQLVPGDVVPLEAGDRVSADLRLVEAARLQADESVLTGESLPVTKHLEPLPPDTPLTERNNLVFKGTTISRGAGLGVVVATGLDTELGRISKLVSTAEAQDTPLEKRLNALGRRLVWLVLAMASVIALVGIATGREMVLALEVAIALAVAAIPEGLPIVATIALARGMWRMARRNALIVRLSAVETLGATAVLLTDKTGTLTENRMTLRAIELADASVTVDGSGLVTHGEFRVDGATPSAGLLDRIDELLTTAVLCNNASLEVEPDGEARVVGDPTETALLVAAAKRGIQAETVRLDFPERREEPFDPERKAMATFNDVSGGVTVHVKGAPEAILPMCQSVRTLQGDQPLDDELRHKLLEGAHGLGRGSLRTLAFATRIAGDVNEPAYERLVLLGIAGLQDPPRRGVGAALARFRDAGVRVIMVTGDHVATAAHIAAELGLIGSPDQTGAVVDAAGLFGPDGSITLERADAVRVIARATPQQKLALIEWFQGRGNVVAMTGDGVNDAPALKQADIGIAMGIRGTAVAREAAAMVLQDDELGTIGEAIAQGRTIYANIRKFVVYLFSCNASEVMIVGLATLAGAPLPLLPLQILFLNLVTDVFPALALGVGAGSPALMQRPPRPAGEPLLARRHWLRILFDGLVISAAVLGAMAIALLVLDFDTGRAVTVSFCTLAFAQLWHVFNQRDRSEAWLFNEVTRNPWVWLAIALCAGLVLLAVHVPWVAVPLDLQPPGAAGWCVVLVMSMAPLLLGPARVLMGSHRLSRTSGKGANG